MGYDYDGPEKGRLGLMVKLGLLPEALVPEPQTGAGASSVSILALGKLAFFERYGRHPYASLVIDTARTESKEVQQ